MASDLSSRRLSLCEILFSAPNNQITDTVWEHAVIPKEPGTATVFLGKLSREG